MSYSITEKHGQIKFHYPCFINNSNALIVVDKKRTYGYMVLIPFYKTTYTVWCNRREMEFVINNRTGKLFEKYASQNKISIDAIRIMCLRCSYLKHHKKNWIESLYQE